MKRLAVLLFSLALAACASAPQTAQQTVYQAEASYNAAAQIVIAYKALPRCGTPAATALCSRDDVIAQLRQADQIAYAALLAAENTARTPGAGANAQTALVAANQAIAALSTIAATLQTK